MFLLIHSSHFLLVQHHHISIHLMFLLIKTQAQCLPIWSDFNTSHVSINQLSSASSSGWLSYFNTSHVSINLGKNFSFLSQEYFNTSHVSINQDGTTFVTFREHNFNTSHVSINPVSPLRTM